MRSSGFLDRETAKIDALIANKQRLIELLQEKRTALISHAVTKGLDPGVPMKESGIEWLGRDACPLERLSRSSTSREMNAGAFTDGDWNDHRS